MAAGPGDRRTADAAACGYLRASHADRERVIDVLKAAFAQGRLTKAELDARVGRTFASQIYGELAALAANLPPGLIIARRPVKAAPARIRPAGRADKYVVPVLSHIRHGRDAQERPCTATAAVSAGVCFKASYFLLQIRQL